MSSNLNSLTVAVCECGKEQRTLTFRQLKNKWPFCECKQSMKVLPDATSPIRTGNRMGNARGVSKPERGEGNID
jgi:hypothetical protein